MFKGIELSSWAYPVLEIVHRLKVDVQGGSSDAASDHAPVALTGSDLIIRMRAVSASDEIPSTAFRTIFAMLLLV
jgi:hypothetical protein